MNLDEFLNMFSFSNICKYNDSDVSSYAFKNKPVPELNFFEFEIDQAFVESNRNGIAVLVN